MHYVKVLFALAFFCASVPPVSADEPAAAAPAAEPATPAAETPAADPPVAKTPVPTPGKRAARPASPAYQWVELDHVMSYSGDGDVGARGEGLRLGASVPITPRLYALVRIERDTFHTTFFGAFEIDVTKTGTSLGLGTHFPVARSTHGFLNVTYESLKDKVDIGDPNDPASSVSFALDSRGFGAELGFRTMLSPSGELTASYKRTELEGDYSDTVDTEETSADTLVAQLALRVNGPFDVVMRFEHTGIDLTSRVDTDGDGAIDTRENSHARHETYAFGVRYRF